MEDDEGIRLVLARATELKLKICDCLDKATTSHLQSPKQQEEEALENGHENPKSIEDKDEAKLGEEEAQNLLHIRDALESLENQLSSLQDLRQRQQYEKQVALAEIDHSRKSLLEKLNEYKGKGLEIINETSAFVGERVDYDSDLLLPPYPSRPPNQLGLGDGYVLNLNLTQKPKRNCMDSGESPSSALNGNLVAAQTRNPRRGFGSFVGAVAKVVIPLVGVLSILYYTGLGMDLRERGIPYVRCHVLNQNKTKRGKRTKAECPPGKVLVMENGEARCLVKERVEIPFDSGVLNRDVRYGYG